MMPGSTLEKGSKVEAVALKIRTRKGLKPDSQYSRLYIKDSEYPTLTNFVVASLFF
jgi:hypothetical protein